MGMVLAALALLALVVGFVVPMSDGAMASEAPVMAHQHDHGDHAQHGQHGQQDDGDDAQASHPCHCVSVVCASFTPPGSQAEAQPLAPRSLDYGPAPERALAARALIPLLRPPKA